jgi:hypothetical protein
VEDINQMEYEKVLVRRGIRVCREKVKSVWKQTWSLAGTTLRRESSARPVMNPSMRCSGCCLLGVVKHVE